MVLHIGFGENMKNKKIKNYYEYLDTRRVKSKLAEQNTLRKTTTRTITLSNKIHNGDPMFSIGRCLRLRFDTQNTSLNNDIHK